MNEKVKNMDEDKRTNYELLAVAKNIRPLIRELLGKKGIMQLEILSHWQDIVGADLAAYSFPEKIEFRQNAKSGGIAHLIVPSGAFALELQHREKQIISKINTYFGYNAVCGIRIRQDGEFNFISQGKKSEKDKNPPLLVNDDDKKYITEISSEVKDEKLKEILIKLGYSVFNQKNKQQ